MLPNETPYLVPTDHVPTQTGQIPDKTPPLLPNETPYLVPTDHVPTQTGQTPDKTPPLLPNETPQLVPTAAAQHAPTPTGQVPTGSPTDGGGLVPQPSGNTEIPWSTLRAPTNSGPQTPGSSVVPGDPASGTPTSVLSARHNVGEQSTPVLQNVGNTHTGPAASSPSQGAPPEGELAHTGADGVGVLAGMAASLIAAGSGLVLAGRRKKDNEDEEPDAAG